MHERIESDQVGGSKRRTRRTPNGRAGDRIDVTDPIALGLHHMQAAKHVVGAQSIGDKVRRVLCLEHAFAQPMTAEIGHQLHDLRPGLRARDEFQEFGVAGWVEEMGA